MPIPASLSFAQIIENNDVVDRSIEDLVNLACSLDEETPRADRLQLQKTTRLLFLTSLMMGEREDELDDFEDGSQRH